MEFLPESLDIDYEKINRLEKELDISRSLLEESISSLKQTQQYLMKLAYNQAELSKRISQWPYIAVNVSKKSSDDDMENF